jgi:hypothetical protein
MLGPFELNHFEYKIPILALFDLKARSLTVYLTCFGLAFEFFAIYFIETYSPS